MAAGVRLRVTWISDKGRSMGVWRLLEIPGECTLSTLGAILNAALETETADFGTFFLPGEGAMFVEWGEFGTQNSASEHDRVYIAQRTYLQDLLRIANKWGWLLETERGMHMYAIVDAGSLPQLRCPKVLDGAGVAPPYQRRSKRKKTALPFEVMNHFLATSFALNNKKVERRSCEEMFDDFSQSKMGVGGKRAKNAQIIEDWRAPATVLDETLASMLAGYDKEELLNVAEDKGLEILPGRRIQDIAADVANFMLDEENILRVLHVLADDELKALRQFLKGRIPRWDESPFHMLFITAYISENANGDPQMAKDLAERFRELVPRIDDEERKRRSWFYASLQTAGGLYVSFPVTLLSAYMERGGYAPVSFQEIKTLFETIPLEARGGKIRKNGKFWFNIFDVDEWDPLVPLSKKPFYIPTREEIREGAFTPIFAPTMYQEEVTGFFQDVIDFAADEAHEIWTRLTWVFFAGNDVNFAFDVLQNEGYLERLPKNKEGDLRHLLARVYRQTRSVTLKGFTPGEIAKRKEKEREEHAKAKGRVVQKVISLQERQRLKQRQMQARKGNVE